MGEVSYFQDKGIPCPVCKASFQREVLRSGRGRMIAGDLAPDLRRLYKASEKYAAANPILYTAVVCPECFYAAWPEDFTGAPPEAVAILKKNRDLRKKWTTRLFGTLDYRSERTLSMGAAGFLLCLMSYAAFPGEFAPCTKRAVSALRASWMLADLHAADPSAGYGRLYVFTRRLAWHLYERASGLALTGKETFDNLKAHGPDIDMNYGFDGTLYLQGYLGLENLDFIDPSERLAKLAEYRIAIAKLFGMGKVSKSRPGPLMELSRALHEKLGAQITALGG